MQLVVMTYNILWTSFWVDWGQHTCKFKSHCYGRCAQDEEIRKWQPDVVGTQESNGRACADALCQRVGPSFKTAAGGEALIFNSSTLELVPHSTGYTKLRHCDAWACRAFGWAKYRTKGENFTFWHFNVHMTHEHGNPRGYQGEIALDMYEKYRELSPCGEPVVMTGDWNPHKDMVYGSAWRRGGMNAAQKVLVERNFTMLDKPSNQDGDICFFCDRIFYSTRDFEVVDHWTGMRSGSDHTPHIATLKAKRPLEDYSTCEIGQPTAAPTAISAEPVAEGSPACCGNCGHQGFCSPVSQRCYSSKNKHYYVGCSKPSQNEVATHAPTPEPTLVPTESADSNNGSLACCKDCGQENFCSPVSQRCYSSKNKDYYLSCSKPSQSEAPTLAPTPQPVRAPTPASDSTAQLTCCTACGQAKFCSPVSQRCYGSKNKHYYLSCSKASNGAFLPPAPTQTCCAGCGDSGFCSPVSSRCYVTRKKTYYLSCSLP